MPVTGKIASFARGEIPEDWRALDESAYYGASLLTSKVNSVMLSLFDEVLTEAEQDSLDDRVAEYAGKLVALSLINPAISYWSKQPTSVGATGRNENKAYGARANILREIRENLLAETRLMWAEVEVLLPNRRIRRIANIPSVSQAGTTTPHTTPNPFDFEEPFGRV